MIPFVPGDRVKLSAAWFDGSGKFDKPNARKRVGCVVLMFSPLGVRVKWDDLKVKQSFHVRFLEKVTNE